MTLQLNENRMGVIQPSATLEMARKARALRIQGVDVANLSAGEPDFPTPACIREAAVRALSDGIKATHYTPARGTEELIEAMRSKLRRDQGTEFAVEEVIPTVGTKGGLSLAFDALLGPGDEVIIFSPYWVTYPDLVRLSGATPVIVPTERANGYQPDPERLRAAITPHTKALVLNTPGNPTGAGLGRECIAALMKELEGTDIWVLSDEIYEKLTYDGFEHTSPLSISEDARSRTLFLGGVAKGYAMTGWRLGVAAGPKLLIDAMILLQQQRVTCPTGVAQAAAAYAMLEPPEVVTALTEMRSAYTRRRALVLESLRQIPGVHVHSPEGAFYCFVDIRERLPGVHAGRQISDDIHLATLLLEEANVAVVPGTPFGAAGGFRISFASAEANLSKGIGRIADWMSGLAGA